VDVFEREYLADSGGIKLIAHESATAGGKDKVTAQLLVDGEHVTVTGEGNGPLAAFVTAFETVFRSISTSWTTPSMR